MRRPAVRFKVPAVRLRVPAMRMGVPAVRGVALVAPLFVAGCDRAPPSARESAPIRVVTAVSRTLRPRLLPRMEPAPVLANGPPVDWRTDEEQEAMAARERDADPYRVADSIAGSGAGQ